MSDPMIEEEKKCLCKRKRAWQAILLDYERRYTTPLSRIMNFVLC